MADAGMFNARDAQRIANAVMAHERKGRRQPAVTYPTVISSAPAVKRGTFTAPWNKGATVTVRDSADAAVTYQVKNYFANVAGTGAKSCAIAKVGDEWILIAAEC